MSLPFGKAPPSLLSEVVFPFLGTRREDVILGPRKGEDAAVVRAGDRLLVISCDPISGAVSRIGWLAVHVASNDVATTGTRPRWYVPCILLPKNSGPELLREICSHMDRAAEELGVAIVGGHTEVTPGLNHPLIVGCSIGVVEDGRYVTSSGARPSNVIVLTKSAGLEGSAILASDRAEEISSRLGGDLVERAKRFFERVSVLEEALTAFGAGGVTSMHDPTEGGVAGGLHEVADASGTGFEVYEEKIRIEPETSRIAALFQIDPLQLISSGALLITCVEESSDRLVSAIRARGIAAEVIGRVLKDPNRRVIFRGDGSEDELPYPSSDALWTALERNL